MRTGMCALARSLVARLANGTSSMSIQARGTMAATVRLLRVALSRARLASTVGLLRVALSALGLLRVALGRLRLLRVALASGTGSTMGRLAVSLAMALLVLLNNTRALGVSAVKRLTHAVGRVGARATETGAGSTSTSTRVASVMAGRLALLVVVNNASTLGVSAVVCATHVVDTSSGVLVAQSSNTCTSTSAGTGTSGRVTGLLAVGMSMAAVGLGATRSLA